MTESPPRRSSLERAGLEAWLRLLERLRATSPGPLELDTMELDTMGSVAREPVAREPGAREPVVELAAAEHAALAAAYGQREEGYHGLQHVAACLGWLDRDRDLAQHPDALEAALWYHDVVYRPSRDPSLSGDTASDEEESAARAEHGLTALGVAEATVAEVARLVRATAHFETGSSRARGDADLMVDIDLAILGAEPADFERYQRAIRHEYRHVPAPLFRRGRAAVLRTFLDRPAIYRTPRYRHRFERQARANLERALAALEGSSPC